MKNFAYFFCILLSLLFSACTEKENDGDDKNIDQAAFLQNTVNIINRNYQSFYQEVTLLKSKAVSLDSTVKSADILTFRGQLKATYLAWQKVSMLEFGPAETVALRSSVNVYKTDTAQIEANIYSGNYNLDQIAMKNAKGFPALDYLFNGKTELQLEQMLKSESNRLDYLQAVANEIEVKSKQVVNEWNSYQNTFVNASGTDVGSSTGMLINSLNLHFEKFLRDNKIGIPLGIRSAGIAQPEFAEAFYGGYSIDLIKANFEAFKNIYSGESGYGLDDYLIDAGAEDLDQRIENQFVAIDLKLNTLSGTLPFLIQNESAKLQETYNEMQKLIVLLKVDLPSRLGVLITYQDNDGD